MIFTSPFSAQKPYFGQFADLYLKDEQQAVTDLLAALALSPEMQQAVQERATELVTATRANRKGKTGIDAFLAEYSLSSTEGAVLMCLAESLLRIPDSATAEKLIRDKLGSANFDLHVGKSDSTFVNFSTWALMFSGKLVNLAQHHSSNPLDILKKLVGKTGEPVIRAATLQGVRLMGKQFVMGETIKEALKRAQEWESKGYRFSYDMLGESAKTELDAERYFNAYLQALNQLIEAGGTHSLSIKLSALHPRYEFAQRDRVLSELYPRLFQLCEVAARGNIPLTIDAEEADRLSLSLELIDKLSAEPSLLAWQGLGLAVQAYQKRAPAVLDFLIELSTRDKRRFNVRLVKGAYWDSEIKRAQERGLSSYPVYTRKSSTDVSYALCSQKMLAHPQAFYCQFATHNAQTVAWILANAGDQKFEFQRLHGMGEELYEQVVPKGIPCRIYAPVGGYADLLSYLVRRLLENGANTSFVNRLADDEVSVDEIILDPIEKTKATFSHPHPRLPLPVNIYGDRKNSSGVDLSDPAILMPLAEQLSDIRFPMEEHHEKRKNPATGDVLGTISQHNVAEVQKMIETSHAHFRAWDHLGGHQRADILEVMADLIEENRSTYLAYLSLEAGKTMADAVSEVREATDFCRYYAGLARHHFCDAQVLTGPTGELNCLSLHGRGVFACISPWNFPLAIFTGQIAAALAAGNAVVAKPAAQTPLIAQFTIDLFHKAGVPGDILHLAIGSGSTVGQALIAHPKIAGVAFTGSTETAWHINRTLAAKDGPIVPFIAETGGQNCMIVDSSALPEQVVSDIISSSFQSAGQRCSALRVVFIQEEIADKIIDMLKGAMQQLRIGDPAFLSTDIGPVIDRAAQKTLMDHQVMLHEKGHLIHACPLNESHNKGSFFGPAAYEIASLSLLEKEVFGPILHVIRYKESQLDQVIDQINATGYGLTFGLQTRINQTMEYLRERIHAGNMYVNRNMIGAVVGVQPFGGEGLSGTGPKAGGPHALFRYALERSYTLNTTAIGGNTSLVTMEE